MNEFEFESTTYTIASHLLDIFFSIGQLSIVVQPLCHGCKENPYPRWSRPSSAMSKSGAIKDRLPIRECYSGRKPSRGVEKWPSVLIVLISPSSARLGEAHWRQRASSNPQTPNHRNKATERSRSHYSQCG